MTTHDKSITTIARRVVEQCGELADMDCNLLQLITEEEQQSPACLGADTTPRKEDKMARRKWRTKEKGYKDNKWIEVALTEGGKDGIVIAERDVIDGKMRTNAVALSFEEAPAVTTRITELLLEHFQQQETPKAKKEEVS